MTQVGDLVAGPGGAVYEVVVPGDPPVLAVVCVSCPGCGHPYYAAASDAPAARCPDKSHEVWRIAHHVEPAGTSASAALATLRGQ